MQRLLCLTGRRRVRTLRTCFNVPGLSAALHRCGSTAGLSNMQGAVLYFSAAPLGRLSSRQQPEGHGGSFKQLSARCEQHRGAPVLGGERGRAAAAASGRVVVCRDALRLGGAHPTSRFVDGQLSRCEATAAA